MATLTGNENHDISLDQAAAWTKNYRDTISTGQTIAHCFGKGAISDIMAQEGCKGIRMYYALDDVGEKQLIITGVDASGNDLYTGKLAEKSAKCPQMCSTANPLNS